MADWRETKKPPSPLLRHRDYPMLWPPEEIMCVYDSTRARFKVWFCHFLAMWLLEPQVDSAVKKKKKLAVKSQRRHGGNLSEISPFEKAAAAAKSLQSCLTLCDPIDGSPAGSIAPGILQARTLEWVAISFSNALKWKWSRSVMSDS